MASKDSSSEVLRILLIGRTGQGKSSTANSLAGEEGLFKESALLSSKSQTTTCQWSKERSVLGRRVEVVDTPGIFDTELDDDNAKTHKELLKSLLLTMPGFHAIAYVLKCGEKITDEFKKTQDLFFQWFGPRVENFTFVILTWCRTDEMKKEYISKEPQRKLKELVEKCGKRVSIIENKGQPDLKNKQVKLIYKAVDDIKAANGHSYFTNFIYQLALSYFQNKSPQTFTKDSIILLEKAGLKQEIQGWLADIDRNLTGNVSQSTSETSVLVPDSTENTDYEVICGNLSIYDSETNERLPNTSRSIKRNLPEKDMGKNNTKCAIFDEEEKMSDVANENTNGSSSTTEQTSKRKVGSEELKAVAESNGESDLSNRVTLNETALKDRVNKNDQEVTSFAKYLRNLRKKICCIL